MAKLLFRCWALVLPLFLAQAFALEWSMLKAEPAAAAVKSDDALAFLKLDFENNPGWVASIKTGYQWKFFKNVGYKDVLGSHARTATRSNNGMAATFGLGYNFGPRVPITLGLQIGLGPAGNLSTTGFFPNGANTAFIHARQKIRAYTLDASIDYDFKNCTRWTPFIGLTGGVVFMSDRGKAYVNDGGGNEYYGSYGKKHRTNFVGGFRAGTKWKMNDRVTLSLYGSYSYLGSLPSQQYHLATAGGVTAAGRTSKTKIHELDLKFGVKVSF